MKRKSMMISVTTLIICVFTGILIRQLPNDVAFATDQNVVINLPRPDQPNAATSFVPVWQTITIRAHQSLFSILQQHHIMSKDIHLLQKQPFLHYLSFVHSRHLLWIKQNQNHHLLALKYSFSNKIDLFIHYYRQKFVFRIHHYPAVVALVYKSGVIRHNLKQTARNAGVPFQVYRQFNQIFSEKIHQLYPQSNTQFRLLYQEYYVRGNENHPGNIVAAQLIHHGKVDQAFRFTFSHHPPTYYDTEGKTIHSMFLYAPLHYQRISGIFTPHRLDPILHIVKPHLGVDYAAPFGTAIHSIGNGIIAFFGRKGGYGNAIIVRYGEKYKALYGHLARFTNHLHIGQLVTKGEIIGYVGSSGWSTGPHLHFEFYINDVPKDYLAMNHSIIQTIPSRHRQEFYDTTKILLARLKLLSGNARLAQN